jgi:hypothetical protein
MTPTPDIIDRVASAYRNFKYPGMRPLWDDLSAEWKDHYRYCSWYLLTALRNQGLAVTEKNSVEKERGAA